MQTLWVLAEREREREEEEANNRLPLLLYYLEILLLFCTPPLPPSSSISAELPITPFDDFHIPQEGKGGREDGKRKVEERRRGEA